MTECLIEKELQSLAALIFANQAGIAPSEAYDKAIEFLNYEHNKGLDGLLLISNISVDYKISHHGQRVIVKLMRPYDARLNDADIEDIEVDVTRSQDSDLVAAERFMRQKWNEVLKLLGKKLGDVNFINKGYL